MRGRKAIATMAAVALAGLGLAFGAGVAQATNQCNDEPFGEDVGVTVLDAGPLGLYAGADHNLNADGEGFYVATACVGAPDDAEPHTVTWAYAGDPVDWPGQGLIIGAEPVGWFGAQVTDPYVNADLPGGPATGADVTTGQSTCVFAGIEYVCMAPRTLFEAQAANGDTPGAHTTSDCVALNGECQTPDVPTGAAVEVGESGSATAYASGPAGPPVVADVPSTCVEFGAECDQ